MPARHPARGLVAALAGLSCLAAAGCAAGETAAVTAQGQPGSPGSAVTSGGTPAVASTVIPAQLGNTWVYAVDSCVLGKGTEGGLHLSRQGGHGRRAGNPVDHPACSRPPKTSVSGGATRTSSTPRR